MIEIYYTYKLPILFFSISIVLLILINLKEIIQLFKKKV